MKKLLVVAVAVLVSASAFAQKSMVRLDGCLETGRCDSADFHMNGNDGNDVSETSFALNYAHLFTDNFGAGLTYKSKNKATDGDVDAVGDKSSTIGLSGYWNMEGGWSNTCWLALHYNMVTEDDTTDGTEDGNKQTHIVLEYGHRWALGSAWGLNLNYAPSVTYTMGTVTPNNDGDDVKATDLSLNVANFAVLF